MGGGNSVENISRSISKSFTEIIVNVVQSINNQALQEQKMTFDCEGDAFVTAARKALDACGDRNAELLKAGKITQDMWRQANKDCNDAWVCGGRHLTMKGSLMVNLHGEQLGKAQAQVQKELDQSMKQNASQKTGWFQFGNDTKNVVIQESESVSHAISNTLQKMLDNITQTQTIVIKGKSKVEFVSMELAQNNIQKQIQESDTMQKFAEKIKQAADQDASQSAGTGGTILKILIAVVVAIVGILIILGIILFIAKKARKEQSESGGGKSRRSGGGKSRRSGGSKSRSSGGGKSGGSRRSSF